ncbi:hypothetical protein LIER_07557 [Lithospermum erythrorhizon]|uniref:Uncharacterized protein n=1 Tax=Lithospermum erythrorhizon TaxID=34254 RepID=A0AAV3P9T9_LITER
MDKQNISGENQQQHALTTPLPNSQGGQHHPLHVDIKAIIQERIQQEWMTREAEWVAQDHARSSHAGNPSHHGDSHYTDNEESYSDIEARNTTFVAPIRHQREHVQVPSIHSDPIVAAMQQPLDTFKNFMATSFSVSIAQVVLTTKMPFSNRLDAFQHPPSFKLPQLELYDGTETQ